MTRRERILATVTIVLMIGMGGLFLFYVRVYDPLTTVRGQVDLTLEQLSKRRGELAREEAEIKEVLRVNPRLSQWQKISVPPRPSLKRDPKISLEEQNRRHLANMKVEYAKYLGELLRTSGFRSESLLVTNKQPDTRTKLETPKGKQPAYERLAFSVVGKATKDAVVKMLASFHKEPILHQVRNLTLTVPNNTGAVAARGRRDALPPGLLDVKMTVEALVVQGAEPRPTLKPPTLSYPPRVLAQSERDYSVLSQRNVFTGYVPPRNQTPVARQTEDRSDVLRFVKLTTLFYNPDRNRWEATIYDQAAGPRRVEETDDDGNLVKKVIWEKQLNTRILNELVVQDRYNNKILDAKVVHIDEKQLIFKSEDSYFRLRCGDALHPAIERPLNEEELKELGLAE